LILTEVLADVKTVDLPGSETESQNPMRKARSMTERKRLASVG